MRNPIERMPVEIQHAIEQNLFEIEIPGQYMFTTNSFVARELDAERHLMITGVSNSLEMIFEKR